MSKPEKVAPVGTCDYCGKGIPVGEWWTSKGRPRLHCSLECRQAASSRKMENRAEWMRERIDGATPAARRRLGQRTRNLTNTRGF